MRKFKLVYTDPPWKANLTTTKDKNNPFFSVNSARQYKTMSLQELWAIDVAARAADDAAMFMWCLSGYLEPAILTMNRWGFELATIPFIWVKTYEEVRPCKGEPMLVRPRNGNGPYTLPGAELCLLGTRGKIKEVVDFYTGIKQVQYAPVEEHSAKPALFRELIQQMTPRVLPVDRVEMFARGKVKAWRVHGDQAKSYQGVIKFPVREWEAA